MMDEFLHCSKYFDCFDTSPSGFQEVNPHQKQTMDCWLIVIFFLVVKSKLVHAKIDQINEKIIIR